MSLAPAVESAPPCIGRFQLRRRLGAGLQGTVYLARDPELDRPVAVKLLQSVGLKGALSRDEGRNLGRLRHPNVVPVFESGLHRGHRYLVFEFVEGRTLFERMRAVGPMPAAIALPMFRRIVGGVAHAHAQGVIHLDLNPNNIMIEAHDVPRIMDFGLSRRAAERPATGVQAGTPLYMAPEQYADGELGPHTDVYALGLIFYYMFTGRHALKGDTLAAIAIKGREGKIDFGLLADAELDPGVETLLRAALERNPAARIPDAVDLARRLQSIAPGADAGAGTQASGTVEFLLRRMRVRKELPALAATLSEVNRLTAEDSHATPARLGQVVLRDYALTNQLMRLANSAYFGTGGAPIATVSDAIVRLGFDQVRTACNALLYAGRLDAAGGRSAALVELQVEGFVAGLIARHLGRQVEGVEAETAFLCGMFRRLGDTLAHYCFAEECEAIGKAVAAGARPDDAFREVLGLAPHELGAAVGREWKFPTEMIECMAPVRDPLPAALSTDQRLHALVSLAGELAALMTQAPPDEGGAVLERLAARYRHACPLPAETLGRLAVAAGAKFREFEGVIGLSDATSPALVRLHAWLDAQTQA